VRELGRELGLPPSFIGRHPFPGPASRSAAQAKITREKLDILREADAVYIDQIRKHGLMMISGRPSWQSCPCAPSVSWAMARTYDFACALRAVTIRRRDDCGLLSVHHEFLGETATRIINEIPGINRVTYDITSKPPGTIEWE